MNCLQNFQVCELNCNSASATVDWFDVVASQLYTPSAKLSASGNLASETSSPTDPACDGYRTVSVELDVVS